MTVQEYLATPESVTPQELIYGTMRVADSPSPIHQLAVGALYRALHAHVTEQAIGTVWLAPLDVILDEERALVVQPDLFVISDGGAAIVADKVRGAPDLVIEVLSPRPRIGETVERVSLFRDHGVRECWLVHQIERRVDVLEFKSGPVQRRQHEADEVIQSGVLPKFDRSLDAILGW